MKTTTISQATNPATTDPYINAGGSAEFRTRLKMIQKNVANMLLQGPEIETEFAYSTLADIVENAMGAGILIGDGHGRGNGHGGNGNGRGNGNGNGHGHGSQGRIVPSQLQQPAEWSEADLELYLDLTAAS